jgi:hypothetical protein
VELLEGIKFHFADDTGAVEWNDQNIASLKRPAVDQFGKQLELAMRRSRVRPERMTEIIAQIVRQYGYWAGMRGLHPETTPKRIELTGIALNFVMLVCQRLKHAPATPRPHEYSPMVQPNILISPYGAWPMGHATTHHYLLTLSILDQQSLSRSKDHVILYKQRQRIQDTLEIQAKFLDTTGAPILLQPKSRFQNVPLRFPG